MRKILAACAIAAALGAGGAHAEDLTHCQAGSAQTAKAKWAAARTEFKLCLAQGKLTARNAAIAHVNLSAVAYEMRKWPEVVSEYDLAAKTPGFKPEGPQLFFRGLAYAEMKQFTNAKASLDQAIALAPAEPRFRLARMDVLMALKQPDAALADGAALAGAADKGVKVVGHMRRAVIFESMKRDDDALKEIDAAGALDPQNLEIVQARMNLFAATKQYDKALAEGARLANAPVKNAAITGHLARADLFRAQSKPDDALNEINAALKLAPNDPSILLDRMTLYAETDQLDKALADSQALTASKDRETALKGHAFRSVIFDRQKRYGDVLGEADAMLKLDPKSGAGLNNRCTALANLGRASEAVATCQQALAVAPKSPDVWNSMGYALEKAGRLKEAVAYYEKTAQARPQDAHNQADLKRAQGALAAAH